MTQEQDIENNPAENNMDLLVYKNQEQDTEYFQHCFYKIRLQHKLDDNQTVFAGKIFLVDDDYYSQK